MIKVLLIGGAVVAAVLFFGKPMAPIGIRNNNPLNIKYNPANDWQGQTGNNSGFCQFDTTVNGIRAAAVLLKNYINKHGCDNIIKIITRWAPNTENPTNNYIKYVSDKSGIEPDKRITTANIKDIIRPMIYFENGLQPYSDAIINEALQKAGV